MVANEFFDALPIRQFEMRAGVWRERQVGLVGDRLMFVLGEPTPAPLPPDAPEESVFEVNQAGLGQAWLMADRLNKQGGAALIFDYGHARTAYGETLQAVGKHRFANVLAAPGTLDLTAHVDFGALAHMASQTGAAVHGPIRQNAFLSRLNLVGRLERLLEKAPDERSAQTMVAGCQRLLDDEPTGMGRLFKVLALAHPSLGALPVFEFEDSGL
jgi:SAM-dependent MidA family methyltransferase